MHDAEAIVNAGTFLDGAVVDMLFHLKQLFIGAPELEEDWMRADVGVSLHLTPSITFSSRSRRACRRMCLCQQLRASRRELCW